MMKRERLTRIGRIFVEGTLVDRAVEAAARDALTAHKQARVPVVVCRDGKVVTVYARTLLSARSAARRWVRAIRAAEKGVGA
jgi:nicotinamidase-related amidase